MLLLKLETRDKVEHVQAESPIHTTLRQNLLERHTQV